MPKIEKVVADDIVADVGGCSDLVGELEPEPTSFVPSEHKSIPYRHPH